MNEKNRFLTFFFGFVNFERLCICIDILDGLIPHLQPLRLSLALADPLSFPLAASTLREIVKSV